MASYIALMRVRLDTRQSAGLVSRSRPAKHADVLVDIDM